MSSRSRSGGFTLIEVIIAITIVAILARVAYGSYVDHVMRAKRAEGKAALLKAAQLQERNYAVNSTYVDSNALATLFGLTAGAPICSGENPACTDTTVTAYIPGYYNITVDAPTAACPLSQCFVLRAAPRTTGNKPFDDKKGGVLQCGDLTLDSVGNKGVGTGGALSAQDCWLK